MPHFTHRASDLAALTSVENGRILASLIGGSSMRKIMFVAVAALSMFIATGCKKSGSANEAASKMEGFAKSMCDCADKKDKACGDKVQDDMTKWSQEMAKSAGKDTDSKPDPELMKRMTDATTKLGECYGKIAAGGTPEPTKTEDKKPDEKTAEPAKADDKKADEPAKADDKKADDKKPDDKKSGGW
jgi:hypothetical protein